MLRREGARVMIAPVKVQRLRANGSGLSSFDTFEIEREMTLFAPPAQPFPVSALTPASRFVVLQLPDGWSSERDRTPTRQILFCLAGSVRVTPGVGDAVTISAGTLGSWRARPEAATQRRSSLRTLRSGSDPVAG